MHRASISRVVVVLVVVVLVDRGLFTLACGRVVAADCYCRACQSGELSGQKKVAEGQLTLCSLLVAGSATLYGSGGLNALFCDQKMSEASGETDVRFAYCHNLRPKSLSRTGHPVPIQ